MGPLKGLSIGMRSGAATGAPRRLRMRTVTRAGSTPGSRASRSTAGEDSQAACGGRNTSANPGPACAATASLRSSG